MKQFEYSKKHTESSRFLHVKQTGKEILIERVKFQFSPKYMSQIYFEFIEK